MREMKPPKEPDVRAPKMKAKPVKEMPIRAKPVGMKPIRAPREEPKPRFATGSSAAKLGGGRNPL